MKSHITLSTLRKDTIAGAITGLMAIPLSIGICMMSEYPIQTGLYTVVFACLVSFVTYWFKPGNFTGTPGIAAGLAPVLALGIHTFGIGNMPFLILITSIFQMLIWKFKWESYILKAVPNYLVEGLLAGVGVKILLKFLPYTYELTQGQPFLGSWDNSKITLLSLSILGLILFVVLFKRFQKTSPGIPYIVVIGLSILLAFFVEVPMLHIEHTDFKLQFPWTGFSFHRPLILIEMIGYALMLATIDVIEQVMSNVAIEKLDKYSRKTNSNNSLLAIWIANLGSSFFGGMTNLDGLAKSTTNTLAGAVTKTSNLVTGLVILICVLNAQILEYLPYFSLSILMIYSGWKMISGLKHVAQYGKYALILSTFCAILVWKLGIFEGLILALLVHTLINYFVYQHNDYSFKQFCFVIKNKIFESNNSEVV